MIANLAMFVVIVALAVAVLILRHRLRLAEADAQAQRDMFNELVDAGKVVGYTSMRRIVEAAITTPKLVIGDPPKGAQE